MQVCCHCHRRVGLLIWKILIHDRSHNGWCFTDWIKLSLTGEMCNLLTAAKQEARVTEMADFSVLEEASEVSFQKSRGGRNKKRNSAQSSCMLQVWCKVDWVCGYEQMCIEAAAIQAGLFTHSLFFCISRRFKMDICSMTYQSQSIQICQMFVKYTEFCWFVGLCLRSDILTLHSKQFNNSEILNTFDRFAGIHEAHRKSG